MKTKIGQGIKSDIFGWGLLIVVPLVGIIVVNLSPNLRLISDKFSNKSPENLDSNYRYHFSESLRNNPNQKEAIQQEIAFYQQRLAVDSRSGLNRAALAGSYLKMARATGEGGWFLLAEQAAQRSIADLPFDNKGALLVLARIAEARHDFATALRLAKQVGSDNEDAIALEVTSHLAMGKVSEANAAAEALVNRIPNLGSLTLRALVRESQGRDAEVLQDYRQAMAAEEPGEVGGSARARSLLGRFYARRGQFVQAKALFLEALRLVPRYPLALIYLADLETRQGNYREAEGYYSKISAYSGGAATLFDRTVDRGMARVKELQGDAIESRRLRDKAEAGLRQEQALGSRGFGHRRDLASLLLEKGRSQDVAEALALMQEEVKIRRDAAGLDTLAWALSAAGEWQKADRVMAEIRKSGIRDAGMFYRAGAIARTLGKDAESRAYFQKSKEIDPNFDDRSRQALGLGSYEF
ncbi:Tetratricopeptide TPR_2 repeat-containing protein [Oscillatoria nigro-viridis PCC 7112]|uniref:Tetratricopeptide TPR_2 repeat-containing protein n=1 Tax=Phormidium nigroviride PCC 7112 TaxID=179408 RepID=K9VMT0_9CYAN|nr:tetratricopeptide repeat protein [Oscillatoria nigro-viridis]AFZ09251.1 Tetratricopeptide TPR_2 repeat-containing protein [Oscillatoria nigro-viridis PCC 7112]